MSKPKLRARMKSLSFDEKIKILEKLRDRSLALAAAGLRQKAVNADGNAGGTKTSGDRIMSKQFEVEIDNKPS